MQFSAAFKKDFSLEILNPLANADIINAFQEVNILSSNPG